MWRPEEPVDLPVSGRVFTSSRRVRLGDVTPKGRLRLDATARYLQDIANDDAVDGTFSDIHGWVVRRTELWVHQFPVYMHDVQLQTWCGGYGSHWAERRTRITSDDGGLIEAAALWVHVDMQTMKPSPLPEDFFALVHESSGGRKIRANLAIGKSLPPLDDPGAVSEEWQIRFADMDAVGHLNNASYWIALEEYLSQHSGRRAPMHATVEHHLPIDPGQQVRIVTQELPERTVLRHVINATDVAAVTQIVAL
jgi:acyl-ACP thioesterase